MISMQGIRAILFDLDGTLRHNEPDSTQVFLDLAVGLGAQDGPLKRRHLARWTHYYWAQSPELSQDMQVFESISDEFWANYAVRALVEFGCQGDCAGQIAVELHGRMAQIYHPHDCVAPDVGPTLAKLQAAGYRLGVLSNRDHPFADYMRTLGLAQYFDVIMAAGEVNIWKPDRRVFWQALERIDVSAAQSIYVGDNYYADIEGARSAGMTPILIDPDSIFENPACLVIRQIGDLQAYF
jgi:putative hydrolase of the HAD superfamily